MVIGERYKEITGGFNSIRDDAKSMVDQLADNKIDIFERTTNVWMKIARGDISNRFDKVKGIYLDVTKDTKGQIDREHVILEAYRDYRGALKQAEVLALEVLKTATAKLDAERTALKEASDKVANFAGTRPRSVRASSWPGTNISGACRMRRSGIESRRILSGQSHHFLQYVGGCDGAPSANDQRQRAHLRPGHFFFLNEQLGPYSAQGFVHRHVRPPSSRPKP